MSWIDSVDERSVLNKDECEQMEQDNSACEHCGPAEMTEMKMQESPATLKMTRD